MKLPIVLPQAEPWKRCLTGLTALCLSLGGAAAHAMTSVLIWPIDPVIESDQHAAALWLENHDNKPVTLQIRVLGWSQAKGDDVYDERQTRVAGSPPMAVVPPGKRQLIRLTRLAPTTPGVEEAYRVMIDEVPQPHRRRFAADRHDHVGHSFPDALFDSVVYRRPRPLDQGRSGPAP
jgi:fimbrial chaperone protein